jgi:hypothetical protein
MFFDIFDMIHYLIGLLIVGFLVWIIIQIHNHFSKEMIPIPSQANSGPI